MPVEYRKLGKWGVKVSEIALGSWLTYGGSVERDESVKQIEFAYAQGINFFDTANVYAHGASEEVVGKAIKNLDRDQVFVATKVFFPMGDGPNDKGLSRKHVWEQCHHSLKRLQMDYVDLYQCHRWDPETPIEELVTTMDILTRQGKILYWGVSEWPADQIQLACDTARAMNAPPPVSNQPCYNMLQRGIEKEVIPTSWKNGMGQVVFSPASINPTRHRLRTVVRQQNAKASSSVVAKPCRRLHWKRWRISQKWPRSWGSPLRNWHLPGFCVCRKSAVSSSAPREPRKLKKTSWQPVKNFRKTPSRASTKF
jgi:aryl-alcohol dehydrogenase-like predicted oxidoreductase